jgi:hypothetical protein
MNADHSEVYEIEKRLRNSIRKIHGLTALVGHAKQVRDYDSDRRKTLLAQCMLPYLKGGASAAAAEVDGRADPRYVAGLNDLAGQREDAEKTIAEWDAAFCTYEAARSLLSMAKETIRTIE